VSRLKTKMVVGSSARSRRSATSCAPTAGRKSTRQCGARKRFAHDTTWRLKTFRISGGGGDVTLATTVPYVTHKIARTTVHSQTKIAERERSALFFCATRLPLRNFGCPPGAWPPARTLVEPGPARQLLGSPEVHVCNHFVVAVFNNDVVELETGNRFDMGRDSAK
jgi:hypothetical protein